MNQKYKSLFKDMGIFALGTVGSKLVLFFLIPIYTHILTDEEYGIADLVFTIGNLLLPFISIAIFNGLLRFGLIKGNKKNALLCASIIFLVGSSLTILLTPVIDLYSPISNWKWYLCAYVIVSFARSNSLVYLKVSDKNKIFSVLSILQATFLVACNLVLLIWFKLGIRGYLLSTIISNAVLVVLAFKLGKIWEDVSTATYNKVLMKEMILYSIPFVFNDLSWWVILSFNKIMIEWYLSSAVLGIYTAASKMPALVNVLTGIFSQAWGLAAIKERDTTDDVSFYSKVFQYFSIVIFGMTILVISITKPFMNVYVGKSFVESWHYVPLLLVSAAFSAISVFGGNMFGALKRSKSIMTTTMTAGTVNIIINYLLIPVIGIYGAVIGNVVSYFVVATLRIWELKKCININFDLRKLSLLIVLTILQALFVGFDYYANRVTFLTLIAFIIIVRKDVMPIYLFLLKRR